MSLRRSRNCVSTPMPHPTSNTGAGASAVPPDRASQIFARYVEIDQKMLAQAFFALTSPTRQSFYGIRRRTARRRTAKVLFRRDYLRRRLLFLLIFGTL